jgi:hypothetical protein
MFPLGQRNPKLQCGAGSEAQFVEKEDVVSLLLDEEGLGAAAGDGPGLNEREEKLRGVAPQDHDGDRPVFGVQHRLDGVNINAAVRASEEIREHRLPAVEGLRDGFHRGGVHPAWVVFGGQQDVPVRGE